MEVAIKDLGEIITGNTPSKKEESFWDSDDICFVKPDGLADDGITLIRDSSEYLSENARKKARVVSEDAVFVTCIGSIGKIGIASGGDYAFNQQINVVVPNEKVLPRYLAYNLLFSKPRLETIANAPVVPIINKTQFGEFTISIEESIDKQEQIVRTLDNLSGIICCRKAELKELDNLIKARFVEMFGDPNINNMNWNMSVISDIGRCVAGATPSTAKPEYWDNGTIPWLSSGEVNKGRIYETDTKITQQGYDNASTKMVPAKTVVLAMAGQGKTRGTAAITEIELCTNQSICSIVNNERVNHEYLLAFLKMQYKELRKASTSAEGRGGLNLKIIGAYPIMIPPIELQNQFATFVAQVDKSKVAIQKALDEANVLFDSLMQQFFG